MQGLVVPFGFFRSVPDRIRAMQILAGISKTGLVARVSEFKLLCFSDRMLTLPSKFFECIVNFLSLALPLLVAFGRVIGGIFAGPRLLILPKFSEGILDFAVERILFSSASLTHGIEIMRHF